MTTPYASFDKTPAGDLDFGIEWATWLGSDTIASSTWATPTGLTAHNPDHDTNSTLVWLSGGTLNARYLVKNTIITAAGRTESRILQITITER